MGYKYGGNSLKMYCTLSVEFHKYTFLALIVSLYNYTFKKFACTFNIPVSTLDSITVL